MGKHGLRMGCFVAAALFSIGCTPESERDRLARAASEEARRRQDEANYVVWRIRYIKDLRTNLCFAYHWGGEASGGPSLATVPCEVVPARLLTVAQ